MNLRPTHRIGGYGILVIIGLAAALLLGRPEPAVLIAPFAVFLAIGLALGPPPAIDLRCALERDRVVEDDTVGFTMHCRTPGLEVTPLLPNAVVVVDDTHTPSQRALVIRPTRWGVFDVGTVLARASDPLRLWVRESMLTSPASLRVHPRIERLRRVFPPAELQPFVGQHPSRARGDGFELAEVRPYAVGDRAGAVNWRATARRGSLWVNDRHPERTGDVVLLHDTFGTAEDDRVALLDAGVHTLSALARAYERTHDRVGLVTFGGHLRWLRPGAGRRNLVRIIDGMLDTERLLTDAWEDVLRVPVGAIPPRSLLVAVTSLDHDTTLHTLVDLRARGFDVAVLTLPVRPDGDERVRRLDALLRDARRRRLERFGVAVADLAGGVDAAIEEVSAWRRRLARSSR